jgi:hypothetical protein
MSYDISKINFVANDQMILKLKLANNLSTGSVTNYRLKTSDIIVENHMINRAIN